MFDVVVCAQPWCARLIPSVLCVTQVAQPSHSWTLRTTATPMTPYEAVMASDSVASAFALRLRAAAAVARPATTPRARVAPQSIQITACLSRACRLARPGRT